MDESASFLLSRPAPGPGQGLEGWPPAPATILCLVATSKAIVLCVAVAPAATLRLVAAPAVEGRDTLPRMGCRCCFLASSFLDWDLQMLLLPWVTLLLPCTDTNHRLTHLTLRNGKRKVPSMTSAASACRSPASLLCSSGLLPATATDIAQLSKLSIASPPLPSQVH